MQSSPAKFVEVTVTKRGRFWAVHADGELVAVVVYKKGARRVQELLSGEPVVEAYSVLNSSAKTSLTAR